MSNAEWWAIDIFGHADLLDALRARKNELNLSHERLEDICGFTKGHIDKVWRGEKRMGWMFIPTILNALGLKIILTIDEPQVRLLQARWEGRNSKQIRVRPIEIDAALLEAAKREVFRDMGRRGGLMRAATLTPEQITKIARQAALARWGKTDGAGGNTRKSNSTRAFRKARSDRQTQARAEEKASAANRRRASPTAATGATAD